MSNHKYNEPWTPAEKEIVIDLIAEAIKCHINMAAKYKAREAIEQIGGSHLVIGEKDTITVKFSIETIGNDILTALGAAKEIIRKKGDKNGNT